jgi:hypothetical protein
MSVAVILRCRPLLTAVACLELATARCALAQRADAGWHPAPLRPPSWVVPAVSWGSTPPSAAARDSTRFPPTYWLEGAAILGGLSGAFGAYAGVDLCRNSEGCHNPVPSALVGLLLVGWVGFGVGALIGGLFPKG